MERRLQRWDCNNDELRFYSKIIFIVIEDLKLSHYGDLLVVSLFLIWTQIKYTFGISFLWREVSIWVGWDFLMRLVIVSNVKESLYPSRVKEIGLNIWWICIRTSQCVRIWFLVRVIGRQNQSHNLKEKKKRCRLKKSWWEWKKEE